MEPKVTLADENQDSYQCPFSAHHMFDKMPNPNSTSKSVVDERSDSTVLALQHLTNFSGVRKRKLGEYLAEKWDPITKKGVWLGTFNTAEEASEAYLTKQREFGSARHMFDEMPSSNSTNNNVAGAERSKADNGKTKTPFIKEISFHNKSPSFGAELHNMGRLKKQNPFKKRKVSKSFNSNMHDQGKERISCKHNSCSMSKSSNGSPKAKTGLLGIREQKNGRYGAEIRDPIRHKQVWLGTFDTIEEASQAYLSKKAEFDMLSQGNKEKKPKNCDQTHRESSVGASLFVAKDQTLNASNVGRNKEKKPKNCDQTHRESSVGASMFVANDQTLNAANVGRNKEKKPKNCDQIQPESSVGASLFVANDQTLNAANVGRSKKLNSPKTMRILGVHKNKWGKYTSEIINPISKKKIWLGTFSTYEEALEVYQSKKLEFKKLVKPKKKCNKKSHSAAREKQVGKEKLGNAKQGRVNCEGFQPESVAEETFHANQYLKFYIQRSKETALQSNMPIDFCTWEKQTGKEVNQGHVNCERFQPKSAVKFDVQRSKEAELQSKTPTDFSTLEKQGGQEDADLWMGQWVQLPGGKEVNFSLKLGLPIIDNYGSLLGEFSSLDDLRIYDESIY